MVHTQNGHIGTTAGATLGYFTESVVIDTQEADRTGGLSGAGTHDGAFRAQTGEGETIAAAGLLDQCGIAQGRENTAFLFAHVVADGEHKAGGQLAQWGTCTGKGRRIREKLTVRQHFVITNRGLHNVTAIGFFRASHMICDSPECPIDRFRWCAVRFAADIALFEHFAGVIAHFNGR